MTHTNQIALLCACVLMVLGTGAALAQQSPVTISFAWYGDPAITKDYETLVARFEELNPDVRVEMLRWGWTADATQKFVVQVATGVAPDVFMIPTIVEGALLPLDDLLASEPGLAEQYVPGSLDYMRATVDEYGITRRGEGPIIGLPMYSLATAIAH